MRLLHKFSKLQIIVGSLILATTLSFGTVYAVTSMKSKFTSGTDCQGTCVALTSSGAKPNTIAVPVGTYVQFNSADGRSHNLSNGKGGEEHVHSGKFRSGEFKADEGWRVQFSKEGSYFLHDHLNPKINVLVVVYTPGKDYTVDLN